MALDPDSASPASELERLIGDLSASGELVFVFGVGWYTAHLVGTSHPVFRGPNERRSWHVELGDDHAKWVMDIRVDEIAGVRFVRAPNPFPHFPGEESLIVCFDGPDGGGVLACYLARLYDGQTLRQDKVIAWQKLRERYGDREESWVEGGSLHPPAVAA